MNRVLFLCIAWFAVACGSGDEERPGFGENPKLLPTGEVPKGPVEGAVQYRGFQEVERILTERLTKPAAPSRAMMLRHVPIQLTQLLGRQTGTGVVSEFANGDPNPLNMMIWLVALKGLGQDLAGQCITEPENELQAADIALVKERLNQETLDITASLCDWQDEDFDRETAMEALWHQLVGFEAPASEKAAWVLYFSSEESRSQPATVAIEAMVVGALYNPYFLLNQ